VESWPTCLIYDIFVVETNTIGVQNVASFMYGNGVLVETGVDCFVACIGLDSYYVLRAMKDWFSIWNNNPYTAHFSRYYSTTLKRWM
jgi:hypothetical protein